MLDKEEGSCTGHSLIFHEVWPSHCWLRHGGREEKRERMSFFFFVCVAFPDFVWYVFIFGSFWHQTTLLHNYLAWTFSAS